MKKIIFISGIFTLALWACNEPEPKQNRTDQDTVYLNNDTEKTTAPIEETQKDTEPQELGHYFYKHFEGNINEKAAVVMELIKEREKISGQYYYKSTGIPISISGTIDKTGTITMQEYSDEGETGAFNVTLHSDGKLSGTWANMTTMKSFGVEMLENYDNSLRFELKYKQDVMHLRENADLASFTHYISTLVPQNSIAELTDSIYKKIFGFEPKNHDFEALSKEYIQVNSKEFRSAEEADIFNDWESYLYANVKYNDNNILCLEIGGYYYMGGAHGNSYAEFITFDKQNNKFVTLKDILNLGTEKQVAEKLLKALLNQVEVETLDDLQNEGFSTEYIKPTENFYLTPKAIVFHYNPYEIAPYAAGAPEISLAFDDLSEVIINKELIDRIKK